MPELGYVIANRNNSGAAIIWMYDMQKQFFTMNGTTQCLTFAEPNRNLNSAIGVKVTDASGNTLPVQFGTDNVRESNVTFTLTAQSPVWLTIAVQVCCKNCTAIGTPSCNISGPSNGAIDGALHNAEDLSQNIKESQTSTLSWWDGFWNASEVNLGDDFRLLEQFWYAMQYTVGASAREGKMAPGLWGPWITTDGAGCYI